MSKDSASANSGSVLSKLRLHSRARCYTFRPRVDKMYLSPQTLPDPGRWRLSSTRRTDRSSGEMLVRSARPEDLEMPLSGFSDYITPIDRFFVRSHVYTPRIDIGQWRLKVEGEVTSSLTLSIDDLRRLPSVELVSVLECAGNGRSFYEPSVAGLQWGHGAVGNARWRGVRLADVLNRAGLKASAKHILFNGADAPIGSMPDFERSIPVAKALHPRTMLAYEMNGAVASDRARLPAARRRAWLGGRLVDQVVDVDLGARQGPRWILDGSRLPASGKASAAGHGRRPGADAAGHQPSREERDRRTARRSSGRRRHASDDTRRRVERRRRTGDRRGRERRRRTQLERRRPCAAISERSSAGGSGSIRGRRLARPTTRSWRGRAMPPGTRSPSIRSGTRPAMPGTSFRASASTW